MLIDDILPEILPELPSCPTPLARSAVRNAAIEFCEKTLAWNELQDSITLIDNQPTYDLEVPDGARVVAVMEGWNATGRIRPKTMAELALLLPDWQTAKSSHPIYYNNAAPAGTVRVFPIPYQSDRSKLTFRVAYAPTRVATEIDDDFVEANFGALCKGAKSSLMAMADKPWSKVAQAGIYAGDFQAAIVDARIKHLMDGVVGGLQAQPRSFGLE